jgi:hypothetical protein
MLLTAASDRIPQTSMRGAGPLGGIAESELTDRQDEAWMVRWLIADLAPRTPATWAFPSRSQFKTYDPGETFAVDQANLAVLWNVQVTGDTIQFQGDQLMNCGNNDVKIANIYVLRQQATNLMSCSHRHAVGRQFEQIDCVIGLLSRYLPTGCFLLWPTRADRVQHHIRRN